MSWQVDLLQAVGVLMIFGGLAWGAHELSKPLGGSMIDIDAAKAGNYEFTPLDERDRVVLACSRCAQTLEIGGNINFLRATTLIQDHDRKCLPNVAGQQARGVQGR